MKNIKINIKFSTTALVVLLTISGLVTIIPAIQAQEPAIMKTYPYIGATPNPIGINQQVLLHVGITQYHSNAAYGWEGLTVTVTRPDGQTETLGPLTTDATGGTGTIYQPTMLGTYLLQTHFPEQEAEVSIRGFGGGIFIPAGTILEASDSEQLALVVQEEPRVYYQGSELPKEYWTRPINAQHREWYKISANYVDTPTNLYSAFNDNAPDTAHILWTTPLLMGGLAGGDTGEHAFECGDAYEGYYSSSTIIGGILFYNDFNSRGGTDVEHNVVAVDLHTGEEIWRRNWDNRMLDFGQVFYWDSYNYHAVFDYLWETTGSTWQAFDAQTGRWEYTMENVPSGSTIRGEKGEIYRINVEENDGWMTLWNSSRVVSNDGSWRPQGNVYDCSTNGSRNGGQEWNVTIPADLQGSARLYDLGNKVVGGSVVSIGGSYVNIWGLSLEPGREGELLFNNTWVGPTEWSASNLSVSFGAGSLEEGVLTVGCKEQRRHWGFSTETGQLMWGPTEPQHYLDIYNFVRYGYIAYGKFFSVGMSGIINAYNAQTGVLEWKYEATDPYTEILWSDNWPIRPLIITDGKIYLSHEEHSPIDPKPRGAPFICLDVETGEEVFRIDGAFRTTFWGGLAVIGDSIIATMDTYDQRIYAIGKGPSATSIEAPLVGVPKGSSATLRGRVTDESPGTSEYALTARFPNGVPVISDDDMSDWMKYVYMQFSRPADVTGVPVKIEIVDPNGEYAWIGTETTDMDGNFAYSFIPQTEGKYMIITSFDGSASYYGSHAITYITVDPAASPSGSIVPGPTAQFPITEVGLIGIVLAIAIVVAAVLLIKKRK